MTIEIMTAEGYKLKLFYNWQSCEYNEKCSVRIERGLTVCQFTPRMFICEEYQRRKIQRGLERPTLEQL